MTTLLKYMEFVALMNASWLFVINETIRCILFIYFFYRFRFRLFIKILFLFIYLFFQLESPGCVPLYSSLTIQDEIC